MSELDYKESWSPKNWWFWTVVLEKTLESPFACKDIQPVHPKGDRSWVFIGRLMLKLKLWYFGHLMRRVDSLEKTLMLGGIGSKKRRGRQRMRWLNGITNLMDMGLVESGSWLWTGRPGVLWFMGSQKVGHDSATELILISVLYWAHLCMKYSLGISNFLENISSLSHFTVFLYFLHWSLTRLS